MNLGSKKFEKIEIDISDIPSISLVQIYRKGDFFSVVVEYKAYQILLINCTKHPNISEEDFE